MIYNILNIIKYELNINNINFKKGPIKTMNRCIEKAQNEYFLESYPSSAYLLDIIRCMIEFNNISNMKLCCINFINKIKSNKNNTSIKEIVRIKNGFYI